MSRAKGVIEKLQSKWPDLKIFDAAYEEMLQFLDSPEELLELIRWGIQESPRSLTIVDDALCHVPLEAMRELAELSLSVVRRGRNAGQAADIITRISLQSPTTLHPLLDDILDLAPRRSSDGWSWPWHESGRLGLNRLFREFENPTRPLSRRNIWACLAETREEAALNFCRDRFNDMEPEAELNDCLLEFDRFWDGAVFRVTVDEKGPFHLRFPDAYLAKGSHPKWRRVHPTWREGSHVADAKLGGHADGKCLCCGSTLHRLIEFEIPASLSPVSGLPRLTLATCLSCLGWTQAPLFYAHDANGGVEQVNKDIVRKEPEVESTALLETPVSICKLAPRWRWQDWGDANGRSNLHRIGGHPCWIQSAEYPSCPRCAKLMPFLCQLDSDLLCEGGGEWLWGSGGICYGFWCDDCKVSGFTWQCT